MTLRKLLATPFLIIASLFHKLAELVAGENFAYRAKEIEQLTIAKMGGAPTKGFRKPARRKATKAKKKK